MLLDPLQSRALLRRAVEERFAILAVNADSPSAIVDCLEAARECAAPIIIETSLWQLEGPSFGAGDAALGLARYIADLALLAGSTRFRDVPAILHTDHIKGPKTLPLLGAAIRGLPAHFHGIEIALRPSTISLDSSEMGEAENIAAISALCRVAEDCGQPVTLEMEAGVDAGITPVEVARRLLGEVERAHPGCVHLWAPGVGTQHGLAERGEAFSADAVRAHREAAEAICGRSVGIALHGSSGLPEASLRMAVEAGVVKVNWSSESLLIRSHAARQYFAMHGAQLEKSHPDFKASAMDRGVQAFIAARHRPRVAELIRLLGGEGAAAPTRPD